MSRRPPSARFSGDVREIAAPLSLKTVQRHPTCTPASKSSRRPRPRPAMLTAPRAELPRAVTQNRLDHRIIETQTVQVTRKAAPETVPAVPEAVSLVQFEQVIRFRVVFCLRPAAIEATVKQRQDVISCQIVEMCAHDVETLLWPRSPELPPATNCSRWWRMSLLVAEVRTMRL